MSPDDKKRMTWFVLALAVIFMQNIYAETRAERARAAAMVDAAEIKVLLEWAVIRSDRL